MNQWKHYAFTLSVAQCRDGWAGVWDALVAALRGQQRPCAPRSYTVEFWAAQTEPVCSDSGMLHGSQSYINGVEVKQ